MALQSSSSIRTLMPNAVAGDLMEEGGAAEDKALLSGGGLGPPFHFWNDSVFWFEEGGKKRFGNCGRSTM